MTGVRYLIFSYDDWDDPEGGGWDHLRLKSQAQTVEEAKAEFVARCLETAISNGTKRSKNLVHDTYQVVDVATLELVEFGEIIHELDEGETYYTRIELRRMER